MSAKYKDAILRVKGANEAAAMLNELADGIARGQIGDKDFRNIMRAALEIANANTPIRAGRLLSGNRLEFPARGKAVLFNRVSYAIYVHEGTSRMQPRPFFRIALNMVRQRFPALYVKDAREFIQKLQEKHKPK